MVDTDQHKQSETPKIDPLSPYYLSNQDGPGSSLTRVKLRSDNYEEWSRSMRMSLKSRRKFGFCDGTISKPTDKFYLDQWEVVNCTIVQWIMHSIDPALKDSISYVEEAYVLWSELQERFSVVDGSKIHSLKTQISQCKQAKGMSVTTYYGNLKSLWDALAAYEPPFARKCGNCTCGIAAESVKRQDNERLHQFFMGLDDKLYDVARSQQLMLDPLPTLNRAYHVVLQEERLRVIPVSPADVPDVMAYAVNSDPRLPLKDWREVREQERQEKRKLLCTHCNTRGHDVKSCFIKHNNFPEWWGDRPRTLEGLRRRSGPGSSTSSRPATAPGAGSAGSVVRANVIFPSPASHSSADTERLSGPFFEDDDWSR